MPVGIPLSLVFLSGQRYIAEYNQKVAFNKVQQYNRGIIIGFSKGTVTGLWKCVSGGDGAKLWLAED